MILLVKICKALKPQWEEVPLKCVVMTILRWPYAFLSEMN